MIFLNKKPSSSGSLTFLSLLVTAFLTALFAGSLGAFLGIKLLSPPPIQINQGSSKTFIVDKVTPSIVTIRARFPLGETKQIQEKIGVGLVVKEDGYLMTNAHLVEGAREIFVKLWRRKEIAAKLQGIAKESDLALLKVPLKNLPLPNFGISQKIKLGEPVIAIGKPFLISKNYLITSGIISSLPVNLPKGSPKLLQTDAAISPGNSGGPLVNIKGEVIAITTAYLSTGDNAPGIGFAIPIDVVLKVTEEMSKGKK